MTAREYKFISSRQQSKMALYSFNYIRKINNETARLILE